MSTQDKQEDVVEYEDRVAGEPFIDDDIELSRLPRDQRPRGGPIPTQRGERIPFETQRANKLTYPERPGYVRRVSNDSPGRIQGLVNAGWRLVPAVKVGGGGEDKNLGMGDMIRWHVGQEKTGAPLYAYLLEQKKEIYDQDQQVKKDKLDKIDKQLNRGITNQPGENTEGQYIPAEGIKVKTGRAVNT